VGTEWANHSVKFGWRVEGIYPPMVDGTHINTVEESKDHSLIVTGDDYGHVNIYRNPVKENHFGKVYRGHSEDVTAVRFHGLGEYLISVGGEDKTVI
jgi:microtubule-associated protein-like 1/2